MILDTDIMIDFLRDREEAPNLLEEDRSLETTDINVFELYHSAHKSENSEKNLSALKGFLNRIRIHSTSEESMELAGKIAAGLEDEERVGVKDILIGSIAMLQNQPVLTRNLKDFRRIEGLEVLEPR